MDKRRLVTVADQFPRWDDFRQYHKKNPKTWRAFEEVALEMIRDLNFKKVSARHVFETCRVDYARKQRKDGFSYNNNWTKYYARVFITKYPEYKDKFEFRVQVHA